MLAKNCTCKRVGSPLRNSPRTPAGTAAHPNPARARQLLRRNISALERRKSKRTPVRIVLRELEPLKEMIPALRRPDKTAPCRAGHSKLDAVLRSSTPASWRHTRPGPRSRARSIAANRNGPHPEVKSLRPSPTVCSGSAWSPTMALLTASTGPRQSVLPACRKARRTRLSSPPAMPPAAVRASPNWFCQICALPLVPETAAGC